MQRMSTRPLSSRQSGSPTRLLLAAAAAGVALAGVGGCQSMTRTVTAPQDPVPARPEERAAPMRPTVTVTAADLYSWGPGAAAQELEFYDELERRDLVAHDDLFHAALLFARGRSAGTYSERLDLVRREGWVDQRFARPAKESATIGEASLVMARLMRLPGSGTPEGATTALQQRGLLPDGVQAGQRLSGRQMLALLAGAHDAMAAGTLEGEAIVRRPAETGPSTLHDPLTVAGGEDFDEFLLPSLPDPASPDRIPARAQAEPAPAVAAAPPQARPIETAPPPAGPAPRVRPEPLPDMPAQARQVQPTQPPPEPNEPAAAAQTPSTPPPPPPAASPTPRPWVGGRPLSGKRYGGQ